MRQDRGRGEDRPGPAGEPGSRGEYGPGYEGPLQGPAPQSPRASETRPRRAGPTGSRATDGPDVFDTNYDLDHGYAVRGGAPGPRPRARRTFRGLDPGGALPSWDEPEPSDEYGPARYGYGPYYDRLRRRRRSDAEISQEVEDTLFYDTWVDADAITVTVDDGVVTLRGVLPSFEELRYAVDDAWDVDGVRGVRSELDVDEGGMPAHPGGAESGGERARVDDPSTTGDAPARRSDPEWRRHLHGHPDAGAGPREAEEEAQTPGTARRGRPGGTMAVPGSEAGTPGPRRGARAGRGRTRGSGEGAEPGRAGRHSRGRPAGGRETAPASDAEPGSMGGEQSPETKLGGEGRPA